MSDEIQPGAKRVQFWIAFGVSVCAAIGIVAGCIKWSASKADASEMREKFDKVNQRVDAEYFKGLQQDIRDEYVIRSLDAIQADVRQIRDQQAEQAHGSRRR